MGAIFGIVGQGSLAEVQAMGLCLSHRGAQQMVWSPAPEVYFGQVVGESLSPLPGSPLAADTQLDQTSESATDLAELLARDSGSGVAQLRGCFALAFYDAGARQLLLAVDQVGYKTIYYATLPDRFAFATEYKALLALSDLSAEPNRDAVQRYLGTHQQWLGRTLLAGVRALAAGQLLRVGADGTHPTIYWQPRIQEVSRSRAGHAEAVREALLRTVTRQVGSHGEIGLTLGGGLDAASVLGAIRRVAPDRPVLSFTIGTGEDDPEVVGGRETARIFGTEHHECLFAYDSTPGQLPRLVWLTEDCGGHEEGLLQLSILGQAGNHARLIMGGHGADVLFGGMPRYRLVSMVEGLPLFETPMRELFLLSQSGIPPRSVLGKVAQRWYYGSFYPPVPQVPSAGPSDPVIWEHALNDFIRRTIQYVPSLRYLEPAHEVVSTSFRSPFLDPDFIATSLTVPARFKVRWGPRKRVLRDAVVDLVPPAIYQRRKAIQHLGQGSELAQVLVGMADELLPQGSLVSRGLLREGDLQQVRARCSSPRGQNLRGRREQIYRLWTVLSLEWWARHFLDRRGAPWPPSDSAAAPNLLPD